MITRHQIAPNGPEFSRLAYGTWRILDEADPANCTPQALLSRFKACADMGITTLDTAEIYGIYKVEEAIGGALKLDPSFRSKIEIVTKSGIYIPCEFHPDRKVAHYNVTAARIIKSAEKSLRFMGIDEIDLLLVHRPDWLTSADETAEGLNKLLKDGKIRSAGVSNYNVHQFDLLNSRMDQPLVTNQVEFSLLHMDPIYDGTADQCQRHRILPMAWSPLAKGALMDTQDPAAVRLHAKAAELSAKYNGATLDQLAYAWIMAHPSCPLPIIGTNKLERIQAVVKAADIKLEREDWYGLWQAAKGHGVP
ncbi:MAG: aldo/keto reductase [Prosthecobacter sp.]|uniref:aldo/keto reductase n=1 Tax=Prosthecobacter sp. TaxID=1965333 RepID=UPI0025E33C74|nr:aldo/keto reductase [Prosthecobacter sp.]MCF7784557.1 aldo/keto reductase [Prosthecobacter sp.]